MPGAADKAFCMHPRNPPRKRRRSKANFAPALFLRLGERAYPARFPPLLPKSYILDADRLRA